MLTLTDHLERWAETDPHRSLFTFLNRSGHPVFSYTYASFHARTNGLARVLVEEVGVAHGEPVLLVYPPGLEMIVAFIACSKAGAIPVPVPPPSAAALALANERLTLVAASAGAKWALTDKVLFSAISAVREALPLTSTAMPQIRFIEMDWIATNDLGEPAEHFDRRDQPLLFLQYTSGSTRAPRGVMVSHENVITNCRATVDHVPVGVSWLPHFHDMGLIGYYLFPIVLGGSAIHFSPTDFLRRPLLWLETISRFGGTATSAPNFAFEYCLQRDKIPDAAARKLRLGTLRLMMNASEPVRPYTMERFLARFHVAGLSAKALQVSYGLAENTLCASHRGCGQLLVSKRLLARNKLRVIRDCSRQRSSVPIVNCGQSLAGVDIRIVDPDTCASASEDEVGEIWLAGHSKALGYWKRPELSRDVFQARLVDEAHGSDYLRTGDIGFIHEGDLYVCGRLRDMIIVRGVNIHPVDMEVVVERALAPNGPVKVVVFGAGKGEENDHGIVVLIETRPGNELPDLATLYQKLRGHSHAPLVTIAYVPKGSLTRTSSGKISRHQCRDLWNRGALKIIDRFDLVAYGADDSDIVSYIERLPGLSDSHSDTTLEEIGLDSFELVTLSLEIERFLEQKVGRGWLPDGAFDLRTLQSMTVGELKRMAKDIKAGRTSMHSVRLSYRETAQSVADRDGRQMREDGRLPAHIRGYPNGPAGPARGTGPVLLTGATGFLGSHVLEALLRTTDEKVVVVARGQDIEHAGRRVAGALARARGAANDGHGNVDSRIEVLSGDVALPRFGLSEPDWQTLADRLRGVIHCAAETDYVKTYDELRGSNVLGTRETITLCCTGAPKVLHHVSSTFIFGWSRDPVVFENDYNAAMRGLDFGYAETKWVAERLVQEAIGRGLDARIYRPSLITASRRGHYVREDLLVRVLSYMIRHKLSVDALNQLSFLPVDVCAQNIVSLARLDNPGTRVFHLTADHYYSMQMACQRITDRCGYAFKYVDIESFINHMNRHCGPDDILFPLLVFFRTNRHKINLMRNKRYDNANYRAARAKSDQILPEPDLVDTMEWIIQFLQREKIVSPAGNYGDALCEPAVSRVDAVTAAEPGHE